MNNLLAPASDALRLATLNEYGILDTPVENLFDNITRLIANTCQMPVACIGLVDESRLWLKSTYGLENIKEIPRDSAPCAEAILHTDLTEIEDLANDSRYSDSSLVIDMNLHFYASMPLINPQGFTLGTLALLDQRPNSLSSEQRSMIKELATVVVSLFELKKAETEATSFGMTLDRSFSEIYVFDVNTLHFLYANENALVNLQYSYEEMRQMTPSALNKAFTVKKCKELLDPLNFAQRNQAEFESIVRRSDRSKYPVDVRIQRSGASTGSVYVAIVNDINERKKAERTLHNSEELNRRILNSSSDCIKILDLKARLISINDAGLCLMEIDENSEYIGKSWLEFWPEASFADMRKAIKDAKCGLIGRFSGACPTASGKSKYWDVKITSLLDDLGKPFRLIAISRDITEIKAVQDALYREKELAQVTLASIADAVITTDSNGHVSYLNPVAEQLTGWSTVQAHGRPLEQIFNIINETTREPVENPVGRVLREGIVTGLANHTILISKNGIEYAIEDSAAPILTREGKRSGAVLVFHDMTSAKDLANQLSYQASHDDLTGLVNRREFEQQLKLSLDNARTTQKTHSLMYLDLDQFKVVNDTCGHLAGDELLQQLSGLLLSKMRQSDSLARLGGDEFAILLEGCSVDQGERLARALLETIHGFRFTWRDKVFNIGASIGLAPLTADSTDIESVLSAADTACHLAKFNGRNRVQVFQMADLEVERHSREMDWVSRITRGLEKNQFQLYFQKIIPIDDSESDSIQHKVAFHRIERLSSRKCQQPVSQFRCAGRSA